MTGPYFQPCKVPVVPAYLSDTAWRVQSILASWYLFSEADDSTAQPLVNGSVSNLQNLQELFPNHDEEELRDVANSSLNVEDAVATILDTLDDTAGYVIETSGQQIEGKHFAFNKLPKMKFSKVGRMGL